MGTTMQPRVRVCCALFSAFVATAAFTDGVAAQSITTFISPAATVPEQLPAMVSYLLNGQLVFQTEVMLTKGFAKTYNSKQLTPGVYDVRVEAEGLVTEAKRGVRVLTDGSHTVNFVVRPGKGMHVVEYATGGLAREEVATRLGALEAAMAKLQPAAAVRP